MKKFKIFLPNITLFFFTILIGILIAQLASEAAISPPNLKYKKYTKLLAGPSWNISATRFNYYNKKKEYELMGCVTIKNKNIRISSNSIILNHEKMEILAKQGALIQINKNYISCKKLKFNLKLFSGSVWDGIIILEKNSIKIIGEKIFILNDNILNLEKGMITSCLGKKPTWSFSGENIKIKKEKHGRIENAKFKIKNLPIFSIPLLIFPTMKRQSGFLFPKIELFNKNCIYSHPLFLKINQFSDLTLYPSLRSDKRISLGLEYQYMLNKINKGFFFLKGTQWFKKSKKKTLNNYWLKLKCSQKIPFGFIAQLSLDLKNRKNIDIFEKDYSKILSTKNNSRENYIFSQENIEANYFILKNAWKNFVFSNITSWNNKLTPTLFYKKQRIPKISSNLKINSFFKKVYKTPVFIKIDLNQKYSNNFDYSGQSKKNIAKFKPTIFIPFLKNNIVRVDLSASSELTEIKTNGIYYLINQRDTYNIKINLYSEISRIIKMNNISWLKHSIRIEAIYDHSSKMEQHNYNYLKKNFSNKYNNLMSYSISNSFLKKYKNNKKKLSLTRYFYKELYFLGIKQIFQKENSSSEIIGNMRLRICNFVDFESEIGWTPSNQEIFLSTSKIHSSKKNIYQLSLAHIYAKNQTETVQTYLKTYLNKNFTVSLIYEYDLLKNKKKTNSFNLSYTAQCWSAIATYSKNKQNDSHLFSLSIKLLGIGYNK